MGVATEFASGTTVPGREVDAPAQERNATGSFAGDICLRNIAALARQLQEALSQSPEITLDGAQFTAIDLLGVQLLLAAHRTATSTQRHFAVVVPARCALRDALASYGLLTTGGAFAPASHPFVDARPTENAA